MQGIDPTSFGLGLVGALAVVVVFKIAFSALKLVLKLAFLFLLAGLGFAAYLGLGG